MKRHAYSYINTKFRTHLKRVHSGHYSGNLCQKLPGDEFPAEIWQITGTGFNWVRAHSQNFVLVLGMRISFKNLVDIGQRVISLRLTWIHVKKLISKIDIEMYLTLLDNIQVT